jgi:NADH-quinone oxidoreductase subunit E
METINNTLGLSEQEISAIDAEISHAPYRSSVAIEALKIVQKQRRWVSDDSLRAIAAYLEMSPEELEGIATFYNHIYRRPVGETIILFCNSVSCWIKDSDGLEAHIAKRIGAGPGETTAGDEYTFIPVPCLGACDRAPVMMVGDELHQDLDADKIDEILPELSAGGREE